MRAIDTRISQAYYKTYEIVGKPPTHLFLGKQEVIMIKEFSDNVFSFLIKKGKVPHLEIPAIGTFMGMTIHETSDETIIATGWTLDDEEKEESHAS